MLTPLCNIVSSFLVSAVLPPVAAAKSMITEPFFIALIMEAVINTGAGLPGICAVVITISAFATLSAILAF